MYNNSNNNDVTHITKSTYNAYAVQENAESSEKAR